MLSSRRADVMLSRTIPSHLPLDIYSEPSWQSVKSVPRPGQLSSERLVSDLGNIDDLDMPTVR